MLVVDWSNRFRGTKKLWKYKTLGPTVIKYTKRVIQETMHHSPSFCKILGSHTIVIYIARKFLNQASASVLKSISKSYLRQDI